jgi:2-succinyl-6-hydroxy-2,4-cyclohexadiene-1-carboxylate synthase
MAPDLVLLHGFTQTGASWEPVVRAIGESYTALTPDLRGHGARAADRPVSFAAVRGDLDALVPEGAVLCGYSMGGRIALDWAVRNPGRVARLVLVSSSPGLSEGFERAARRTADDALADRIERRSIEDFVTEWARQPILAGAPEWLHRDRLRNTPAGLAASLRGLGPGVMEPLWDRLPAGTLLVVGERDEKFRAIAERTGLETEVVEGAGHALHAERPEALAAILLRVLAEVRRAG